MSDYSALATATPAALAEHLLGLGDNDIALLLNRGHQPEEIRKCPYRGYVAGLDDEPIPEPPTRPDRLAPNYMPPPGFQVNTAGELEPEHKPLTPEELTAARLRWDLAARRASMDLPPLTDEQLDRILAGEDFDEPDQEEAGGAEDGASPASPRFTLLTARDVQAEPRAPWTIRGIAPRTGLGAIYGPPGSGKSFLVLDLLAHVAEGRDWFGRAVPAPRPVVYLVLEGWGGLADRIRAWETANNRPMPDAIRFVRDAFDLRSASARQALADAILEAGAEGGLLVLDTLNRASPGADENAGPDMSALVAGATELAGQTNALAILVHHVGKDSGKGLRGHSSLLGALDFSLELSRAGDVRTWTLSKSKDGEDGITGMFRLRTVELGTDPETGEPITSCATIPIEPEEGSPMTRRPAKPKTGNRRIIFDKLGELLRKAGDRRPDTAPASLPQGRPCVLLEEVIGQLGEALTCEPKRRGERARSAIASLISEGHFVLEDGHLWSP